MTSRARLTEAAAVEQFRPFVVRMARKYGRGALVEDLIQEGLIAVTLACREWRKDGGASLKTWIKRPVRDAMQKRLRGQLGGGLRYGSRARNRGVSFVSMDADLGPVHGVELEGELTLHDTVGEFEEPPDFFALRRLPAALSILTEQQRAVIRLRFDGGLTNDEVGRRLGFSRERARQIEVAALQTLRVLMTRKKENHVC